MAFEEANRIIEEYGQRKLQEAQSGGRGMGIRHAEGSNSPDDSLAAMKVSFSRKIGDVISVIRYTVRRSLFHAYHGAGKGQAGKKGSTWYNGAGERRKTNPESLSKAGTGSRSSKPFLDTITVDAPELLDQVAEATMDEIFNTAFKNVK